MHHAENCQRKQRKRDIHDTFHNLKVALKYFTMILHLGHYLFAFLKKEN